VFAGTAEYAALWLKTLGNESWFYWYVSAMLVVAFLVSLKLPRHPEYLRHEH
jgi:MHS family alpha-ketoglutarate permease-like MFS transporter